MSSESSREEQMEPWESSIILNPREEFGKGPFWLVGGQVLGWSPFLERDR